MNAIETLRDLAAGLRPESGLLHNCRFEGFGAEAFGEEAIVERFRAAMIDLPHDVVTLEGKRHAAIFGDDFALFADVGDGGVARIWALGDARVARPEAGVSVVFEPDLAQARGDVFFAATDHPELNAAGAIRVSALGQSIARDYPAYRARAFVIRAFGTEARGAALMAMHRLGGDAVRSAGFACVATCWDGHEARIVEDAAGASAAGGADWTPAILA